MRLWRIRLVLVWFGLDCGVFGGGFGVRCGFVAKSRDVGGGWDDDRGCRVTMCSSRIWADRG